MNGAVYSQMTQVTLTFVNGIKAFGRRPSSNASRGRSKWRCERGEKQLILLHKSYSSHRKCGIEASPTSPIEF